MELANLRQQPTDWPVSGRVLSPFSVRKGPSLERQASAPISCIGISVSPFTLK